MGVFRQFPYSNFHDMNMDEIIKIIKNMLEEWATYHAEWDTWMHELEEAWSDYQDESNAQWTAYQNDMNAQWTTYQNVMNTAWQSMQNFINDYFDNLDVQEEVNNKIVSMIQTGEFGQLVNEYIPPAVSSWLSQHITQPTGVVIDTSLTVAGACADAKATGDAIKDVEEDVEYVEAILSIPKTLNENPAVIYGQAKIYNTVSTGNVLISGKNINLIEDFEQSFTTQGGTLIVKAENGIITLNGTTSAGNIQVPLMSGSFAIPAGTEITLSTNNPDIRFIFCNRGIESGSTRTFTTTESSNTCDNTRNVINIPPNTYNDVELHLQAELGGSATEFVPFKGILYQGGETEFFSYDKAVIIGAETIEYTIPKVLSNSYVNVLSLGATGDGVTDDTIALQTAFTNYQKIYIPSGTYIINETLTISNNTEIMGDGNESLIQLGDSYTLTPYEWSTLYGSDNYFYPYIVANEAEGVFIHDIAVQGNLTTEDEHIHTGICFYDSENCCAERVYTNKINYFPANSLPRPSGQWRRGWGISMFGCTNVVIRDSIFTYSPYENVRIGRNCNYVVVDNCILKYGWRTGLQILRGCGNIVVSNCKITQDDFNLYDTEACITLHSGINEPIHDVVIKDCTLTGALYEPGGGSGNGISFIDSYTYNIVIDNCKITTTGTSNGIYSAGKNTIIKNCSIHCDGNGICFTSLYDNDSVATAINNNVYSVGGLGIYVSGDPNVKFTEIENNKIESTTNHGVYLYNLISSLYAITNNKIKVPVNRNGVHFTSGTTSENSVITNNIFESGSYAIYNTNAVKNIISLNNCVGCTNITDADPDTNIIANNIN